MIDAITFKFLSDLKKNNSKEWFDDHRKTYELAKSNFLEFTQSLIAGVSQFDKNILAANLEAKQCISRLNRDIRFSKDKTPYKSNFFLMINEGGKKSNKACYYLQLQPQQSFAGGGVYMPMPQDLQKLRQEIDYNFTEWKGIVNNKSFLKAYTKGVQSPETLVRVPKGFDIDSEAIDYLKMKGYYTSSSLSDEDLHSKHAVKLVLKHFETVKPILDFLNQAL